MKDSEVISTAIEYVLLVPQTRITDVIFNSELTAMSASSVFAVRLPPCPSGSSLLKYTTRG